jgi:predicted AlkP superfamily pyrophosphatase or phosphodiesterase
MRRVLLGLAFATASLPGLALAEPVLLISIDGLQPADILEAEKYGTAVPHLKSFVREGSYAKSVKGILPTVTYPSHATLLTGASPAKHGVVGNTSFDPMQINQGGWFWYAKSIKIPTLWDVAAKAGYKVANVHWPTSVGADSVHWNLPQYWRTGHDDDRLLMRTLATPLLVEKLEQRTGLVYAQGIDETIEGDENRARFARSLIEQEKPGFSTVYLTALDYTKHRHGPSSSDARKMLERIDIQIGQLVEAQMRSHPDSVIAVVSDHGFAETQHEIGLFRPFIDAGLITLDDEGKVKSWEAMPWPSGGSIAIMLQKPEDQAVKSRVRALLNRLKSDQANQIESFAETIAIAKMGGNPLASFYVNLRFGALAGGFKGKDSTLVGFSKYRGMHGYFPGAPEMHTAFFIKGNGIPKGRNLGVIDMRAVAPTLARILGGALPDAEMPAIKF